MKRRFAALTTFLAMACTFSMAGADDDPRQILREAEFARYRNWISSENESNKRIPHHDPVYDVRYYNIDVRLDPADSTISGTVEIRAESLVDTLSEMKLDLVQALTVDAVTGAVDTGAAFVHADSIITVNLDRTYTTGEPFSVQVTYHGKPDPFGGALGGSGLVWRFRDDIPVFYSLVEPFFSNYWWPCKDVPWDKADSVTAAFTVPSDLMAVSNGLLLDADSTSEEGWTKWTWRHRHPIPPYLISVAASNYVVLEDQFLNGEGTTVPIRNYVYPDIVVEAETTFALLPQMMAHQESLFGIYPFSDEKYGHALMEGNGAMEHNTATSWGSLLVIGNRGTDDTVVHEFAHQYWGDLITCADWNDLWLNEGFASYTEALWREFRGGQGALSRFMSGEEYHGNQSCYVHDVPDGSDLFSSSYFGAVYDKGSWALHMLRRHIGDEDFFAGLMQHKADGLARGGFADTDQFQSSMEAVSGKDLDLFFDQWVYGAGSPTFHVDPMLSDDGDSLWLRIRQSDEQERTFVTDIELAFPLRNSPPARMPTDAAVETEAVIHVDSDDHLFRLATGGEAVDVLFDRDQWLLDEGFIHRLDGDSVFSINELGAEPIISWDVNDPFVSGIHVYSGPTDEGPWTRRNDSIMDIEGSFTGEYDLVNRYWALGFTSDSLSGYHSVPSLGKWTGTIPESTLAVAVAGGKVTLSWNIDDPIATGVHVYRGERRGGRYYRQTEDPLPAMGSFTESIDEVERFYYITVVSDSIPGFETSRSNVVEVEAPSTFALLDGTEDDPASPNPWLLSSGEPYFIRFHLPVTTDVTVEVFDIAGRRVHAVHNGNMEAGFALQVEWDGTNRAGEEVAPGIYFVRIEAGSDTATRKFVVLQ